MEIKIADLDLGLQTRAGTDAETVNNYAEAMADGATFPEVTVFTDGERYWLADGFHRVMAARQNGKATITADVRKGTEDDAVVFGGTANNKQGKRPTRADVQHFLMMVWERREAVFGGTPTGGNLAERCGVSKATGKRFVQERLAEMPKMPAPGSLSQVAVSERPSGSLSQSKMPAPGSLSQVPVSERPSGSLSQSKMPAPGSLSQVPVSERPSGSLSQSKMPAPGSLSQVPVPERPAHLVGADGKAYPVRPVPQRPQTPSVPERPTGSLSQSKMPAPGSMSQVAAPVKASVKPVPNVFRDRNGIPIPNHLEGVFASSFLHDIAGAVSGAKCAIERAMANKSPDVAKLSNRVIAYLQNAYQELKSAMPFCVCPVCKGDGCMACSDVGYQNEDQFKRTPKEMR